MSLDVHPPMPFVVGAPRSGTTLLRLMLDANPALWVPAETGFMVDLFYAFRDEAPLTLARFWEIVTGSHTWRDHTIDAGDFREALESLETFTVADGVRAFYRLGAALEGKPRGGDKTPLYVNHMRRIEQLLPEAHFVHIIRDGRGAAASVRKSAFASDVEDIEALADLWAKSVDLGRRTGLGMPNYLEVAYEQLLHEPEQVLRSICDFIDLPYDDAMLDYHERAADRMQSLQDQERPDGRVITREARLAQHANVARPPDVSRIDHWKSELSDQEQRVFRGYAGHVLAALGYDDELPRGALRVLLTNCSMAGRAGTQLYLRDLAVALQSRGHQPIIYSPSGGPFADEVRSLGIPVVERLDSSFPEPDVVHCQHHDEAIAALSRFPSSPGVYVQHAAQDWQDETPIHPRLLRYVAVDEQCRQRVLATGVPADRAVVVGNGVDLARFLERPALPSAPARGLLLSNYTYEGDSMLEALREACTRSGIELDVRGSGMQQPLERPEEVLGDYDIVFGVGRTALEALAVGCSVLVIGNNALAGLVTGDVVEEWRQWSFTGPLLTHPIDVDLLCSEIARFDATDAARCREWVRTHCSMDDTVESVLGAYAAVISEWGTVRDQTTPPGELIIVATQLAAVGPLRFEKHQLEKRLAFVTRERDGFKEYSAKLREGIENYLSERAIRALQQERDAAVAERDAARAQLAAARAAATEEPEQD